MLCSTTRLRTCVVPILLALCTASVHSESPRIVVEPKDEKVVKVGDSFEFICRAYKPIVYCSIKNPLGSLGVKENSKKNSYEYFGRGFKTGDCGIKFLSVAKELHGNISCTMGFEDSDNEGVGFTNLIVAIPPTAVKLRIDKKRYKEKEEIKMNCEADGGRPAPTVTLYLGNDTLASSRPGQNFVNYNRQADYKDNNKMVICKASHVASSLDNAPMTQENLNIEFKPQPINNLGTINKFGFFEGSEGIISLDIFSNPAPSKLVWKVDGQVPDPGLYYPADSKPDQNEDGSYAAKLRIYKVAAEDVDKTFSLTATNQHGSETYNVRISFDPTPKEEETSLGAGSIVAIIVAVLIVFVAIVLTLFARTTGRWCFAGRAGKENHSNSEAQFEAEDKNAGNDNPNHHDEEPPQYDVISDSDHKSNGKKADKDTPVLEDSETHVKAGWLPTIGSSYKAVATTEEASSVAPPKNNEPKLNTAPRAVLETNIDIEESGGVLQSSDTESADKVAVGTAQNAGIRIRNYLRDKINSFKTSSKVPTSEEEARDAEAVEQKTAPPPSSDGVVYAELELRKPGETPVIRDDGEKTEYAQIVIPPAQNAAKV